MSIISMMENPGLASLLVTLAAQSILISLLGILAVKWLARKPAPVRGLVCSGAIAALGLAFVISIGFHLSSNSFSKRLVLRSSLKSRKKMRFNVILASVKPYYTDTLVDAGKGAGATGARGEGGEEEGDDGDAVRTRSLEHGGS